MIPKKIHYVWLGGKPIPEELRECMDSWKRVMPEYEIIRWDESRLDEIDSIFVKEALEERKFAFASDYIRLHALYHEGGLYFDTDLMVFRPFDEFLTLPAFIGAENACYVSRFYTPVCLTSFCMGSEAGHPFIKKALEYYKDRHFIRSREKWLPDDLKYETTVNSFILMELAKMDGYDAGHKAQFPQVLNNGLTIFAPQIFNPIYPSSESFAEHRAVGSWRAGWQKGSKVSLKTKLKERARHIFLRGVSRMGLIVLKRK